MVFTKLTHIFNVTSVKIPIRNKQGHSEIPMEKERMAKKILNKKSNNSRIALPDIKTNLKLK